jgi:antitoxin (DNA-binding transcriptional repressor) of toxin-antitoxin stability system
MRRVEVALFELLFEELIDEVASSGEPIVITRDGEPLVSLEPATRATLFILKGVTRP